MTLNFNLDNNVTQETWCKKIDLYQTIAWILKAWNSVKAETISNCFTKSFENAYVKEVNTEYDDFPCFEINPKFDENLLYDLVEKYENECSEKEETNDNSVEEVEEDTVITGFEAYEYAKKLEKYFQANIPDKMNKIWDLIDEIQGEKASRQLKITDFIMCQKNKNCNK